MRRRLAYALGIVLTMTGSARAVIDMTGTWAVCGDCRIGGVCDPLSPSPTDADTWTFTQVGSTLTVQSARFTGFTFHGTIDSATGAFAWDPPPANLIGVDAVATFSTFDGTYDSTLQTGSLIGARSCNPMAPACDDGTSCTDDACVSTTIGTCTDVPPSNVCVNKQNGACTTTTTPGTTTTTTLLPPDQHPVTGAKLLMKKSSSGRETLIFVTKDPAVYVPAFGAPDDPTLGGAHIDVYTATGVSSGLNVPAGVGKPGWQTKPAPPTYQFKNSFAPSGISVVRAVKLRAGKGLKIVAREIGLPMTQPLGAVGLVWTTPSSIGAANRVCAHFGAATVTKDVPPVFKARNAPAPANCNLETLQQP